MISRNWSYWSLFFAISLLLASCGRSNIYGTDGSGIWPDGGTDGMTDGPLPCTPTCEKICQMMKDCAIITSGQVKDCENKCKSDPTSPEILCLGQLVCKPPPPNCTAVKQCTVNPQVPDLTLSSFGASSSISGQIDYQARVCNTGTGAASTFRVHFYRRLSAPPKPGQMGERQVQINGLASGACHTVSIKDTGLAAGTYNTWVQVDAEKAVLETDENNNVDGPQPVKVSGTTTDKPDLVVRTLSPSVDAAAGTVTYTVSVCNAGKGIAAATTVDIYLNRSSAPTASVPGTTQLKTGTLPAGICMSMNSAKVPLTSGTTYQSWAYVDRLNSVIESNEGNNVYGPVKFSVSTTKLPDLVVSLSANSSPTGLVNYMVTVCNKGQATAAASVVEIYYNRSTQPPSSTPGNMKLAMTALPPGVCRGTYVPAKLLPGKYSSWAYVDRINSVKESIESNNTYGPVTFTVGGPIYDPDLVITGMKASTSSSGAVTYFINVCNYGKATSPATTVDLYYNRSSQPSSSSTPNDKASVSSLAPGACTSVTINATFKTGTYTSWAYVDRVNYVKESNEGNNIYGPVKVIVGGTDPKPDLVVTNVTNGTNSYGYTYYYITVCNKGGQSATTAALDLYYNRSSKPSSSTPGDMISSVYNLAAGACTTRTMAVVLTPGTYSSWVYVDRGNTVSESNEGNNVYGPVKVTVAGTGKPDLHIINVSTSQTSTYTYYYVTVCNKGTARSGTTYMDLYYNRSSVPPTSLQGNLETYLSSLNAGACMTRTFYATLPGGTYNSWVRVDRKNVVYESNESNNYYGPVKVTVTGTGKPDLQITNVTTSPSSSGTYTYYYVTVCNKGTASAGYARIELWYNRTSKPPSTLPGDRYTTSPTLMAGACSTRTIYAYLGPGTYNSWLWVDRTNAVLETNENNNTYGPVKVTVGTAQQSDLVITSLKAVPGKPGPGTPPGTTMYYITVCNKGAASSSTTYVDVYFNAKGTPPASQKGDMATYVYGLAPGACTSRTINAMLKPGTYYSYARVDRMNYVKESNENNNTYGPVKFTVGGPPTRPDLTITKFSANASSGTYVTYSMAVCNNGQASSAATYVDLYYNRSTAPTPGTVGNQTMNVSPLSAGQCTSVSHNASLKPGTYSSWAYVDRSNYVQEINENNNITGPYTFTAGSSTAKCTLVCNTLISPCGLMTSSQFNTCMSMCTALPSTKVDCAYKAAQSKSCMSIFYCLYT